MFGKPPRENNFMRIDSPNKLFFRINFKCFELFLAIIENMKNQKTFLKLLYCILMPSIFIKKYVKILSFIFKFSNRILSLKISLKCFQGLLSNTISKELFLKTFQTSP